MNQRALLEKISLGPVYLYCEFEEVALRTVMADGEMEVYVKYRDTREFKAVYDSRLVGIALSDNPVQITKEEYYNF